MRASFSLAFLFACACGPSASTSTSTRTSSPEPAHVASAAPALEFRNNRCQLPANCPGPGNCPSPSEMECPESLLPTAPIGTTATRQEDGTCWVQCDQPNQCTAGGPMRVRCPREGEPPATIESALRVPAQTTYREGDSLIARNEDLRCDLRQCRGTDCPQPARLWPVPCPAQLIPHVAANIVPVSTPDGCFYGTIPVACLAEQHTYR